MQVSTFLWAARLNKPFCFKEAWPFGSISQTIGWLLGIWIGGLYHIPQSVWRGMMWIDHFLHHIQIKSQDISIILQWNAISQKSLVNIYIYKFIICINHLQYMSWSLEAFHLRDWQVVPRHQSHVVSLPNVAGCFAPERVAHRCRASEARSPNLSANQIVEPHGFKDQMVQSSGWDSRPDAVAWMSEM